MNHASSDSPRSRSQPFTAEDDATLREALKRCPVGTYQAAAEFRRTGDVAHLPVVVLGIIERYVSADLKAKLTDADDDLNMREDLGFDSLTMMEIVMSVEEVIQISIENEELRSLGTLGDVKMFIDCKVRGVPLPAPTTFLSFDQIASVMPIQPPFLFLNEASVNTRCANAKYAISGQEFFFGGHFKDNPVLPASIMLEALGQLALLFLLKSEIGDGGASIDPKTILFTSCEGVRCHRICRPGDVLSLSVKPKRIKVPLAIFEGRIHVGQEKAAVAEEFALAFAFADSSGEPAKLTRYPSVEQPLEVGVKDLSRGAEGRHRRLGTKAKSADSRKITEEKTRKGEASSKAVAQRRGQ